jgi:cytochrome oxidase Cu insertion factor (SCO1/SenC/PrrC family)
MSRMAASPAVLLALALAWTAPPPGRADDAPPEHTGVKIGDKAPDFNLTDQAGKERSLAGLLKNGPVALVFFRSASW